MLGRPRSDIMERSSGPKVKTHGDVYAVEGFLHLWTGRLSYLVP